MTFLPRRVGEHRSPQLLFSHLPRHDFSQLPMSILANRDQSISERPTKLVVVGMWSNLSYPLPTSSGRAANAVPEALPQVFWLG